MATPCDDRGKKKKTQKRAQLAVTGARRWRPHAITQKKKKKKKKRARLAVTVVSSGRAGAQVAILCNHQRAVPKGHSGQMEKLEARLLELQAELDTLSTDYLAAQRAKNSAKAEGCAPPPPRSRVVCVTAGPTQLPYRCAAGVLRPHISTRDPARVTSALNDRCTSVGLTVNMSGVSLVSSWGGRLGRKVEKKKEQMAKVELTARAKEELKMVALGTSKINYLDPRITIAWCKAREVPLEKARPAP